MPLAFTELHNRELTQQIYCFIKAYIEETGIPPTQREMADACFVATGTIQRHLDRLHTYGFVQRVTGANRGIAISDVTPPFVCPDDPPDG